VHGKTGFLSPVGDVADMVKNALFILRTKTCPTFKKKRPGPGPGV
jgi:hypothetical protein